MSDTDHTRKQCLDLFARMSEYLDNELDASFCRKIERHLAQCPSCQVCLNTLKRTVALCRQVGSLPVPEDVSRRLAKLFLNAGNKKKNA